MKVTREVIYDLLPGYFAGEVSPDTRAIVDEFLQQDPEFSRMLERFRVVFGERRPAAPVDRSRDTVVFERARGFLQKRSELRGYVVAFGLATLFVVMVLMRLVGVTGPPAALWFIALAFALTAAIAGVELLYLKKGDR